ncbi:hypothetical protein [Microcystis phage Mwe-JY26]
MDMELFFGTGAKVAAGAVIVDRGNGKLGVRQKRNCGRCGGAGRSDRWVYTGSVCYNCNGAGVSPTHPFRVVPVYTAEKLAKLERVRTKLAAARAAKAAAKAAAEKAAADARRDAFLAQWADLLIDAVYMNASSGQEWVVSIVEQAHKKCEITEKQAEALRGFIARERAKQQKVSARRHIAAVGEKVIETVRVVVRYRNSHPVYGTSEFIFLEVIEGANAGNLIAYKGKSLLDIADDEVFEIAGKVKEHGSRKDGSPYVLVERPKTTNHVRAVEQAS